jgi:hypothetical protein
MVTPLPVLRVVEEDVSPGELARGGIQRSHSLPPGSHPPLAARANINIDLYRAGVHNSTDVAGLGITDTLSLRKLGPTLAHCYPCHEHA